MLVHYSCRNLVSQKATWGMGQALGTDPGAVPSTGSLSSVLEPIVCLQKQMMVWLKQNIKSYFTPPFQISRALYAPQQVLLTWFWKDLSSGKCRFTGDTLDLDMHIQKPTAVFVSSFPGTETQAQALPWQNHVQEPGANHKNARDPNVRDSILAARPHAELLLSR